MAKRIPGTVGVIAMGLLLSLCLVRMAAAVGIGTRGVLQPDADVKRAAEGARAPYTDAGPPSGAPGKGQTNQPHQVAGIISSRRGDGVLSIQNLAVFGPSSCTALGDPFSPLASPFASGPYTYTYRIRIPADYPSDLVRVELFDPDSINGAANSATVVHTDLAVSLGVPPSETLACPQTAQFQPCLIATGELNLPGVTLNDVNPFWYMRMDENRHGGSNNSGCGSSGAYIPADNTETRFLLSYQQQSPNGSTVTVPLAQYTGQAGDNTRDDGGHLTDLRWVSPGAPASYDQPAAVPTDCGSPNGGDYDPVSCPGGTGPGAGSGFEVSLSQDLPNIVADPTTGDRYLYLDVRAMSGASENGFEIWAGPAAHTGTVSSDVNLRNLQILNNSGALDTAGVQVFSLDYDVVNSGSALRVDVPLAEFGPEYAGETIDVRLFDLDAGAAPPVVFYFDTIARSDYSVSYTDEGGRCTPGLCNDQWVTPPYTIAIPDVSQCDWQNPDPARCTPYYGGRLMVSMQAGSADTYARHVVAPVPTADPSAGCSAFPLTLERHVRSAAPPGSGGSNEYPTLFDYPPVPPDYGDFPAHSPNVLLDDASVGDVFVAYQGSVTGTISWLVWNNGINANASTLAQSLTWPGNSLDYSNHGDGGQPATPLYPHVVRGYVNPNDATDLSLHVGGFVPGSTGSISSNAVRNELQAHINNGRLLRMMVWAVTDNGPPGFPGQFKVQRFVIVQLHGYRVDQGGGTWLLLEFKGWDDSCGQRGVAPAAVTLSGPVGVMVGQPAAFTAALTPMSVTPPLTYTWQADGQPLLVHSGGVTNTAVFTWPASGSYTVSVTAENAYGPPASATVQIGVAQPPAAVILSGPASGGPGRPATFVATVTPANAALPLTYTWQADGQPVLVQTGGVTNTAVFTWPTGGVYSIRVAVESAVGLPVTADWSFDVLTWIYFPVARRP